MASPRMKTSVAMIVKNEERCIERALASIIDKAWEVVVVDTGSTDKTVNIIKEKFPSVKVFKKTFEPWSFGAARNFSIKKCAGDWLFYMDADEIFVGEFPDSNKEQIYNFCIHNLTDAQGEIVKSHCARLIPNKSGVVFNDSSNTGGKMHEIFQSTIHPFNIAPCDTAHIIHDGYLSGIRQEKDKTNRNINLLREQYEAKRTAQNCFYLGQEIFITGDLAESRRLAYEGIDLVDKTNALDITFEPVLLHLLLSCHIALNDEEGVKEFEEKYFDKRYNPENCTSLAKWYMDRDDEAKVLKYAWQAAKGVNSTELPVKFNESNVKFVPFMMLGDLYLKRGDNLLALFYFEMAYGSGSPNIAVLSNCLNLLPKHPRNIDKWEFYARQLYEMTKQSQVRRELANALLNSSIMEKNIEGLQIMNEIEPADTLLNIRQKLIQEGRDDLAKVVKANVYHSVINREKDIDSDLTVIIPTMFKAPQEYMEYNLKMLSKHKAVKEILIINNTGVETPYDVCLDKVRVITPLANVGVNPAWNMGVKDAKGKYYLLLNDDCLVRESALTEAFHLITNHETLGAVTVTTLDQPVDVYENAKVEKTSDRVYFVANEFQKGHSLHGWFIMGRVDEWMEIPNDLKFFYGDNIIHALSMYRGRMVVRITSDYIAHKTSTTVNDMQLYQQGILQTEGVIYQEWVNRYLPAKK